MKIFKKFGKKVYSGKILKLEDKQILVHESNFEGFSGNSYGLVTKNMISQNIKKLYTFAREYKYFNFLIEYENKNLAKFFNQNPIPENIVFEENFFNLVWNIPYPGQYVKIAIKPYKGKTAQGKIKRVLTKKLFHSRGHKVQLEDGTVGRIILKNRV